MEKVGVLLLAQEYKWIDEYWAFPDSLVFTRRLKCFSFPFLASVFFILPYTHCIMLLGCEGAQEIILLM